MKENSRRNRKKSKIDKSNIFLACAMLRLFRLAKQLKQPLLTIQNDLLIKGHRRFFLRDGDAFYSFPTVKHAMLPFDLAEKLAGMKYGTSLPSVSSISTLPIVDKSTDTLNRPIVAVLLGHFNHGKTSLLDALGNHAVQAITNLTSVSKNVKSKEPQVAPKPLTLVELEKHGITQVR
jgi:hypothetical protein